MLGFVPADWNKVIDVSIHPTRIEIVSAMEWIGKPLSPNQLASILDDIKSINHVGYHVRKLAEAGIVEMTYMEPVRSSIEHFYELSPPRP